jgi:hypothetical protein
MTKKELQELESISADINLFWVPGTWFISTLQEAKRRHVLTDANGAKLIMEVLSDSLTIHLIDLLY